MKTKHTEAAWLMLGLGLGPRASGMLVDYWQGSESRSAMPCSTIQTYMHCQVGQRDSACFGPSVRALIEVHVGPLRINQ